jgi:hypothetical protein
MSNAIFQINPLQSNVKLVAGMVKENTPLKAKMLTDSKCYL